MYRSTSLMFFHITTLHYLGGTVDIVGIIFGALVAIVLLILLSLIAVVVTGVALRRRILKRKVNYVPGEKGETQEMNRALEMSGATEEEGINIHTNEYAEQESSTEGRYMGLDAETLDYASVYTQLGRGTQQELDPQGREEEHYYYVGGQQWWEGQRGRHW